MTEQLRLENVISMATEVGFLFCPTLAAHIRVSIGLGLGLGPSFVEPSCCR